MLTGAAAGLRASLRSLRIPALARPARLPTNCPASSLRSSRDSLARKRRSTSPLLAQRTREKWGTRENLFDAFAGLVEILLGGVGGQGEALGAVAVADVVANSVVADPLMRFYIQAVDSGRRGGLGKSRFDGDGSVARLGLRGQGHALQRLHK